MCQQNWNISVRPQSFLCIIWYLFMLNNFLSECKSSSVIDIYCFLCRIQQLGISFYKSKSKILYSVNWIWTIPKGMVTYSYERQDIIQFALKRLTGKAKKSFVRLSPPFTCCWWIVGKMFPSCQFNSVYHKGYNIITIIHEKYFFSYRGLC
jgi:hypothetical protein